MVGKFKVRKDKILFVDFELTCWDHEPPQGESMEIIEIGLVELDVSQFECTRKASFLVRPEHSTVSSYCTELTGISQRMVTKQGRPLAEVSASLRKNWGTANKAWMAWGDDKEAIIRDCAIKNIQNPFSEAFHNFGQQFTFMMGQTKAIGLTKAFELLGETRDGVQHRAEADAYAAALIWLHMAKSMRPQLDSHVSMARSP